MDEKKRKTFKELVDELKPISEQYKQLEPFKQIPKPGYPRFASMNRYKINLKFKEMTETGKAMVDWFKNNVENGFPCGQCGAKTIMTGGDTDSAWTRCESCGHVEAIPFDLIKKRMFDVTGVKK